MKLKNKAVLTIAVCFFSFQTSAADSKVKTEEKSEDQTSSFRCEKLGGTLTELKQKMLSNCDLNRPFSSSLSRAMGEDFYLYCCHKPR